MAQLKDLIVNGKCKVIGNLYLSSLNLNNIPITLNTSSISSADSSSITPGLGLCTAGQVESYITSLISGNS